MAAVLRLQVEVGEAGVQVAEAQVVHGEREMRRWGWEEMRMGRGEDGKR
jgi:hypothetical protein